jgi:hypothetical protein
MAIFTFKGGVHRHENRHDTEKFLLFFVRNGEEVPFYKVRNEGLVQESLQNPGEFSTNLRVGKVFVSRSAFGKQSMFQSFYFTLLSEGADVTITPFSQSETGMRFRGQISFLQRNEILSMLPPDGRSASFVRNQKVLPVKVIKSLISVDKSKMRKGKRLIRINHK